MKTQYRVFVWLAAIALIVATLRFYMKGWAASLGLPNQIGSLISSISIILLAGLVIIFAHEGRAAEGGYWRAAGWWMVFALWSQALIISGILITARTGRATYYEEMNGKHLGMLPVQHALAHTIMAMPLVVVGSAIGGLIYWVAKRGRKVEPALAH